MMSTGVSPVNALTAEIRVAQPSLAPATSPAPSTVSFGELLSHLTQDTAETLRYGEAAAIAGVQAKVSVQHVVDSMMAADRALHTLIAVRDKAVSAYQEITKMAI